MNFRKTLAALLVSALPLAVGAQENKQSSLPEGKKAPALLVPGGKVNVGYEGGLSVFPVLSNTGYTVSPKWTEGEVPWFSVNERKKGSWKIKCDYHYQTAPRTGTLVFNLENGKQQEVPVVQQGNTSSDFFQGDILVKVNSAQASSQNSEGESIAKTYDGDYGTFYHSQWSGGSTKFPVTLTYNFVNAPHIDYIVCTPRRDNSNGRWGVTTVAYNTVDNPGKYVEVLTDHDFGFTGDAMNIKLGAEGADKVKSVRFTVKNGQANFVTCAEMEFFAYNEAEKEGFSDVFTNGLCYQLKPGVTSKELDALQNPFARQLGYYLLNNAYDTCYRVGEFEAYETLGTLRNRLKTNNYNKYENPTGIYFDKGDKNVVFVEGMDDRYPVSLIIKDFGNSANQQESEYALKNGLNVIVAKNKGNSYVSYYTDDYKKAPKVKMHFALAKVNGYFDLERGDTNEDWVKMLANACSDIMDMRTKRIQVAFPTARFKEFCPVKAVELAHNIDSTIYYERDVMGLAKYGIEPKNRQFARVVWNGFMFADGIGAAAENGSVGVWMKPDPAQFEFWGFAHELGHVNQVRPGLHWAGTGETTNNIYSAWVQFKLGPGWYRLESEVTGQDIFSGLKGGRFNCYLEEGVRKGNAWQLQKGPDYGYPSDKITVPNKDHEGRPTGKDTTLLTGNYDHFVKLAPLWQLQLYCTQAGYSPDVYAKVMQAIRTTDERGMSPGQLQMKFMREVCDSTQLNFLPFFEKAGLLKPIHFYVQDYGSDWLVIGEKQINELKAYVADKGYPQPKGEVNYISALNWKMYKDQAPLEGTLNQGCTKTSHNNTPYIQVDHKQWKNVVAFETYNAEGELLRISMHGLGGDNADNYTKVMFPKGSAYIMAVGWDGTRMKCYE